MLWHCIAGRPVGDTRTVDGSEVIAVIALVAATVSAVVAIVSLVLAFREADRRDEEIACLRREADRRDEEITHLRREGERRDEELALLGQQLEEEREARRAQLQARLVVEKGRSEAVPEYRVETHLFITNTGPHPASKISVQLHGPGGNQHGPTYSLAGALMTGETRDMRISTPGDVYYDGPYRVFVQWTDGTDSHREPTDVEVFD
jgi:hypothetical protein